MGCHGKDGGAVLLDDKVAILVDGAFYRRRAYHLFGDKSSEDRAEELVSYCTRHLTSSGYRSRLYRIFYYDCPPLATNLYHPLRNKPIDMKKSQTYKWSIDFYAALANKRKVALRMGKIQEQESCFRIKAKTVNKLCRGEMSFDDVTEADFEPDFVQKGVDMRIGIDIATLASKHQVDQIVLIAGDSDFVPAAKHARREGIDFILDPMWQSIKPELNEHIDGLRSCTERNPDPKAEKLHVDHEKAVAESRAKRGRKSMNRKPGK